MVGAGVGADGVPAGGDEEPGGPAGGGGRGVGELSETHRPGTRYQPPLGLRSQCVGCQAVPGCPGTQRPSTQTQ